MSEAQPIFRPAAHAWAAGLPGRDIAKALRENALLAFPPEAFEEDVIVRSFLGRQQIILNRPQGIHHILVENPDNYRRTAATIRMLRPLLGNGLLLSEGEEWKYQRRTLAPAFAPRTIPLLTRHVVRAADAVVAQLAASAERPRDLLTAMQSRDPEPARFRAAAGSAALDEADQEDYRRAPAPSIGGRAA